jgi:hypothetical protein
MSERGVLYVNEILEDILGPRWIDPPGEIRAAENVAPGAVNAVPRSQTPRAKLAAFLPGCQWSAVGSSDHAFGLELGRCRMVGKRLFVTPRQPTVGVDGLHRKRWLLLPWLKPQPRASDRYGYGATRGIDEDARAASHVVPCSINYF